MDGAKEFLKAQQNATQEAQQQGDISTLSCSIAKLSDADLAEIFKRLPPYERLRVSEVCTRWRDVSRKTWLDVTQLDLSPIPGSSLSAIIKQCPNLLFVFAEGKTFQAEELRWLSRTARQLRSLKFIECAIVGLVGQASANGKTFTAKLFGDRYVTGAFELILHNVSLHQVARTIAGGATYDVAYPLSLKRLQLSGLTPSAIDRSAPTSLVCSWPFPFEALECLILHGRTPLELWQEGVGGVQFAYIVPRAPLRELFLSPLQETLSHFLLEAHLFAKARLEVLFLHGIWRLSSTALCKLATKHPTLRILVLTGTMADDIVPFADAEIQLPARSLYPNGFGSDPLPLLHIFIGNEASERIRFTKTEAIEIHPISEPLPQFLDRPDVAAIFKDVWIAAKIKEAAKRGDNFFDYAADVATGGHLVAQIGQSCLHFAAAKARFSTDCFGLHRMYRRSPTRIELKMDDMKEFHQMQEEAKQKAQQQGTAAGETVVSPTKIKSDAIKQRIGYDPKPVQSDTGTAPTLR